MSCRGICEKGSVDVVSAVYYTIYTIYPPAHKQLRRHLPNPFREFPLSSLVWLFISPIMTFSIKVRSLTFNYARINCYLNYFICISLFFYELFISDFQKYSWKENIYNYKIFWIEKCVYINRNCIQRILAFQS